LGDNWVWNRKPRIFAAVLDQAESGPILLTTASDKYIGRLIIEPINERAPVTREAASHAVLGAALELERAAREKSNGQRVRDDHDDQRAEECRQRAVHEEVRVEYGTVKQETTTIAMRKKKATDRQGWRIRHEKENTDDR